MRLRLAVFISIIQSILFLGHLFIYLTSSRFWGGYATTPAAKLALAILSISFVTASLLGWYSHNPLVRIYYVAAAAWLGLSSFLLLASVLCWVVWRMAFVLKLGWTQAAIADVLYGAALLAAIYGIVNASRLRVNRVAVELPNIPPHWRGRTAALVSDTHLGHVRNLRFIRRVLRNLAELKPDVVFLAGDVYDGTAANFEKLAEPWREFISEVSTPFHHGDTEARRTSDRVMAGTSSGRYDEVPNRLEFSTDTAVMEPNGFLGVYYILGNHEEFYSHAEFMPPLARAGVQALNNEKVDLDGVQLVGVHYRDAIHEREYREILQSIGVDRRRPSILLLHAPVRLQIAEEEGISLQLSGHTHGGQFFPGTLIANRVWGRFVHGLQRVGNLQVLISYGAGTWGPPFRVGTKPEIVLITFA